MTRTATVLLLAAAAFAAVQADVRPASFSPRRRALVRAAPPLPEDAADLPTTRRSRDAKDDAPLSRSLSASPPRGGDLLSAGTRSELGGVLFFGLVNHAVGKCLASAGIGFPAPLAACLFLFAFSVVVQAAKPGWGDAAFELVEPGSAFLARWMTVFFVPGLALLPLAPSMGGPVEVIKVLGVVLIGFIYSLTTTGFTVLGLRTLQGAIVAPEPVPEVKKGKAAEPAAPAPAPAKPYSQETLDMLIKGAVLSGAVSVAATRADHSLKTPIQTVYMTLATIASFVWGARLPAGFNKIVHPLITCTVLTLGITQLTGMATGSSFEDVLRAFKVNSIEPTKMGAGDFLLFMLGPTVASFSVSMYSRRKLMAENFFIVLISMLVSSVGGLFGTAFFVKLIKLGGEAGRVLRLSVLPRNVTTALAIAISQIIGGDISITASAVVLTGILGALVGARTLSAMGIEDPVTRGLGIGAAAQGLGVAAFVGEKDAFPFAAVSMVMTAIGATCLVSVPAVKDLLLRIIEDAPKVAEAAAV